VKRIFINTRLNEELDHPLVPATFYNIFGDAEKGYVSCFGGGWLLLTDQKFVYFHRLTTQTQ